MSNSSLAIKVTCTNIYFVYKSQDLLHGPSSGSIQGLSSLVYSMKKIDALAVAVG